jgi:chloramphenicol-sensitive protein RarD
VLVLLAPALAYLAFLARTGEGHFLTGSGPDTALLLGCGVVTAVPLMLYANAAKGLRLSTIGILQYIAPTLVTVVAVTLMGEEFGRARAIAFPMIWAALALYSVGLVTANRTARA